MSMVFSQVLWAALAAAPAGLPAGDAEPATRKFNEAHELMTVADTPAGWDAAARSWGEFIASYPDDARLLVARVNLCSCLYQKKDYATAAEETERLLKDVPPAFLYRGMVMKLAAMARLEQGRAKADRDPLEKALDAFRALAREYDGKPEAAEVGVRAGEALDLLGRPAEAADELSRWLDKSDKHPLASYARYLLGRNDFRAGKDEEAVAALGTCLGANPTGVQAADARLIRGQALRILQRPAEALPELDAALKQGHPRPDRVHYEKALVLTVLNQPDDAAAEFALTAQTADSPLAADALYRAGCIQGDRGDHAAAAKQFQAALMREPAPKLDQTLRYNLAWSTMQNKEYRAAIDVCLELNRRYPDGAFQVRANYLTAVANEKLADWKAAKEAWQAVASAKTEYRGTALVSAGDAALALQDWDGAAGLYETVLRELPDSDQAPRVELGLARILLERGRLEEAAAAFRRVIDRGKNTETGARAAYLLGVTLLKQDKLEDAADQFVRAAEGAGAFPVWAARSWFQGGTALDTLGQEEQATRCYQQLVKNFPDHPLAKEAQKRLDASKP